MGLRVPVGNRIPPPALERTRSESSPDLIEQALNSTLVPHHWMIRTHWDVHCGIYFGFAGKPNGLQDSHDYSQQWNI